MRKKSVVKIQLLAAIAVACAPATAVTTGFPDDDASARRMLGAATPGSAPLSSLQRGWVERTLASLTLREKVGQLVMPWVGGDYAAVGSPEFEQVRRWI